MIKATELGWTWGQYALLRTILGIYLTIHFLGLLPYSGELFSRAGVLPAVASPIMDVFPGLFIFGDSPVVALGVVVAGALGSWALVLGRADRIGALVAWLALSSLLCRNPLISNPSLPYVGWMLLAHACVLGRRQPWNWRFDPALFAVAWGILALGYSYSGYTKIVSPSWINGQALGHILENPLARPGILQQGLLALPDTWLRIMTWMGLGLELVFAPLILFSRLRPWLWAALLIMHIQLMFLIDFSELSLGMILFHFLTFNPNWIRPLPAAGPMILFYDGACGFCHRSVTFVLHEDRQGAVQFSPLQGDTLPTRVSAQQREALPDSIVLLTPQGELLVRFVALRHLLAGLGGIWRIVAWGMKCVPRRLGDAVYDVVAQIRHRLFRRPEGVCPLVPVDLRARFLP